tara:strand:- start:202 stop:447 length:246 start_codon:yes stop_codon:yes gene_type:complete
MIDDFMYVLENYPDANLASKSARETIAKALVNIMCEHHIVSYTNLDGVDEDPKMENWINYCKSKNSNDSENQMEIPFERGL